MNFLGEDSILHSILVIWGHPISNLGLVVKSRVLYYYDRKIVAPIDNASLPYATLSSGNIVLNCNVLGLIENRPPYLVRMER